MRKTKVKGEVVIDQVNDYECSLSGPVLGFFSNSAVVKICSCVSICMEIWKIKQEKLYMHTHYIYIPIHI